MNISDSQIQMTLDLDTHLTERFRSAKEAMAAGVYRRGLKRCAADLDVAPGNLSVMLSGDGQRHLDIDLLERYVEQTGDRTPIYYLVAKHCGDSSAARDEAVERVQAMLAELPQLLASVGAKGKRGGR
ncbi:MAG: hypothetical protein PWP11_865 [Thauera sp.]|nr:hypothetical protein [Thauera sp.]MDI3489588.1 hypothetical protein [Thauera sp.]